MRHNAILVLIHLAECDQSLLEAALLKCNAGMMRVLRLMNDSREEVRNLLLLLLRMLTKASVKVTKRGRMITESPGFCFDGCGAADVMCAADFGYHS